MDVAGGNDAARRSVGRRLGMSLAVLALTILLASLAAAVPARAAEPLADPTIHAASVILIDRVSGRTLFGKDVHHRRPMASTTKIMTALLVLERCKHLGRSIVVPRNATYSSGLDLRAGERISIGQALLALIVKSANDAGVTLATAVGGSEPAFVSLMNAKARALGLKDTHYDNSTGSIHDPNHYSSAYDLAKLARYAMRDARFRELVDHQHATIRWGPGRVRRVTANNLLFHWDWADGVKSGYTPVAGYCLVGSGQPGLRPLISASLHAPDREQDARDEVSLFEWGSSLFEQTAVVTAGDEVATVPLSGGGEVRVVASATLQEVVRRAAPIRRRLTLPRSFASAPAPGKVVGKAWYASDNVALGSVKLVVAPPEPAPTPSAPAAPAP